MNSPLPPITHSGITLTGLATSTGAPNITIDASQLSAGPGQNWNLLINASHFTMSGLNFSSIPVNFYGVGIGGNGDGLRAPEQMSDVQIIANAFSNGNNSNNFAVTLTTTTNISGVVISNNTFNNLYEAIIVGCNGGTTGKYIINDVVIFHNIFSNITRFAGVEIVNCSGSKNGKITNTQILQNTFSDDMQGVYLDMCEPDSVIDGTLIARNVFVDVIDPAVGINPGVSAEATNDRITNTQIVDNIFYQASDAAQSGAIFIANEGQAPINNVVSGVTITNNTFVGAFAYSAISVVSNEGVSGVTVANTILYGNQVNGLTPGQVRYSIINQSGFTGVNNNIGANPMFVNLSGGDFRLQSGSPAINKGARAGAPKVDLDRQLFHMPPSIGAYQFEGPDICSTHPPAR